jgi:sugar lactone lactonase YvrE
VQYGQTTGLTWALAAPVTRQVLNGSTVAGTTATVSPRNRQAFTLEVYTATQWDTATTTVAAQGVDLLAGNVDGPGYTDGLGPVAGFGPDGLALDANGNRPAHFLSVYGQAFDASGNLIIVGYGNQTVRKITPAGVVTTLAGAPGQGGFADGNGGAARFLFPWGVAVASDGTIYVADSGNQVIRTIDAAGNVATLAGLAGSIGSTDGVGSSARFSYPSGIAMDRNGNLLIADRVGNRIRLCTPAGVVTTLAGNGTAGWVDGNGTSAQFRNPLGVVGAPDGTIYVTEGSNHVIRRIDTAGNVSTLAGTGIGGFADGAASIAQFNGPNGIALLPTGDLLVADSGNYRLRRVTPLGDVSTVAGNGTRAHLDNPDGLQAAFHGLYSVTVNPLGEAFLGELYGVRKAGLGFGVTSVAGAWARFGDQDGQGPGALFNTTYGLAIDGSGTAYVADANGKISRVTPNGQATAIQRLTPGVAMSLARGSDGTLYAGTGTVVQKIAPSGQVTTLAGQSGVMGTADGLGTAALFGGSMPALAVDPSGNVYVADTSSYTIRKIDPAGNVTTLAGSAGVSGTYDGAGVAAQFKRPNGLFWDNATGNVVVFDSGNTVARLRVISPSGVVSSWPGSGGASTISSFSGGVVVDASGNALFTDVNQILKITPGGVMSVAVGNVSQGQNILGPLGTARLAGGRALALTPAGDLVFPTMFGLLQITAP